MDDKERQRILDRAAKQKQLLDNAAPPTAAAAPAPAATPNQPKIRTFGNQSDVTVRVVDENNPPTQVSPRRTAGATVRQGAANPNQGNRSMGARVVNPEVPGPKIRSTQQAGHYGANVVPSAHPGAGAHPAAAPPAAAPPPPGPSFQQQLRTPMQPGVGAPAPAPPAPAASPSIPGSGPPAPPNPNLQAEIESMGRMAASRGGVPGAPVVTPNAPTAAAVAVVSIPESVTVIMSQHARPDTLDGQVRTLRAAGVPDTSMWCWVNPSGVKLNDGLLGRLRRFGSNHDVGPWFRWSLSTCVPTKYTLIIDDDCNPGTQWLQLALQHLEDPANVDSIVASAGSIYRTDAYDSAVLIGPESLHREIVEVDVGRGAWLMPTPLAQAVLPFPRIGSTLSTSLHVAAAMQRAGVSQVVLPYIHNHRDGWGMLESPRPSTMGQRIDRDAQQTPGLPGSAALRAGDYAAYRHAADWKPMCIQTAEALAAEAEASLPEDAPTPPTTTPDTEPAPAEASP